MYFRMMPFFCIHTSQGSVATCLKRGDIFKHEFVANLLPSRLVKKILKNWTTVSEVMAKSFVYCFLTHGVVLITLEVNKHTTKHTGPLYAAVDLWLRRGNWRLHGRAYCKAHPAFW